MSGEPEASLCWSCAHATALACPMVGSGQLQDWITCYTERFMKDPDHGPRPVWRILSCLGYRRGPLPPLGRVFPDAPAIRFKADMHKHATSAEAAREGS